MAVNNPPRWLNAGSHDAEQDRRMISEIIGATEGVADYATSGFSVTEKGTPDMSVDVAPGRAFISGD